MGFAASPEVEIVLLNLEHQEVPSEHMRSLIGNATDLSMFESDGFDIVISNSVIEHLPNLELQRQMASEIQRVGVRHWVQTPNRRFPLEPHFLFPFFQYLPLAAQSWLLAHMDLGWFPRERDPDAARATVRSVRLMTKRELCDLFPNSRVLSERAFGMVKSFIVIGGWQESETGAG
jgi:2-polyprenyl-3-methyl-5-hydroxy-6-metoxy-1,4-benzoquinol methylase